MRKTGTVAADWMRNQYISDATTLKDENRKGRDDYIVDIHGYCQRACRQAWGFTSGGASAIDEWNSIPAKYRHTDPRQAPVGAPHFWRGGTPTATYPKGAGHVAIQAHYKDYIWSTDIPSDNHIGVVHGAYLKNQWTNLTYLGWSSYFCGANLASAFPKDGAGNFVPAPILTVGGT